MRHVFGSMASGSPGGAERAFATALDQQEANLGKVIEFAKQERPAKTQDGTGPMGQLLIFTGVRYERTLPVAQPGPRTPQPANPRRTRG